MDDAREWIAAPGLPGGERIAVAQPGDPWGVPSSRLRGPLTARPAGVWRRGSALSVDCLVVALLDALGRLLASGLSGMPTLAQAFGVSWYLVIPAAYFVLCHGTGGQTLGKALLGVRVVDQRGRPIGYIQALARLLATVLATLPFGLGLAVALFRADRRGAHDLLAGTRVILAREGGEAPQ
jgi:uncharacterized RDD family membrane protein YckC